jgi:thiol-disulfide isomerase/thioredoxin
MLLLLSCTHRPDQQVVFLLKGAFNRHYQVERAGAPGERPVIIDSGAGRSHRDTIILDLPPSEPTVYWIRLQYKSYRIPFIHDSAGMRIVYDFNRDQYHFENSPASTEWQHFREGQDSIGREMRKLDGQPETSIRARLDSLLKLTYGRNFHFADTTTNPALFLLAYNQVDFGKDYNGLAEFMKRASRRFPGHTGVRALVQSTLDYVAIFGSPLKPGDRLPSFQLPDSTGRIGTIGPQSGKYLLIDFWSSWCESCRLFSAAKKQAYRRADTSKFTIISVALDGEEQAWKNIIRFERYPWPQYIDEKMWSGVAARTLRFDSLPYNFLIAPDGRILAKGIATDSLLKFLANFGIIPNKP